MKRLCLLIIYMAATMAMSVSVQAQDYDKLWREVENLEKKDLPRSVIEKTDEIYSLAFKFRNIPQMMKAVVVRAGYKTSLSPDSVEAQLGVLKNWARTEKSVSARAVLNSIIAKIYQSDSYQYTDSVVHYSRLSLADKDELAGISAADFHPVTIQGEVSRTYFNDNMYDFLSRQAINALASCYDYKNTEQIAAEIISIYDSLISLYSEGSYADRSALALVKEAKVVYRYTSCGSAKYRLSYDEAIRELEELASTNKDLDVYCDITLKLADNYRRRERCVDAVKIVDEALRLYPKSRWTKELSGMRDFVTAPQLSVSLPFVYPNIETDMVLEYKNLTDIKVELYRLGLTATSDCLYGMMKYEEILRKYGKRVAVNNYTLPPTLDYKQTKSELKYKFPQAGIYMFKLTTKAKGSKPEYRIVHVSPYQCVTIPLPGGKKEFIAVDMLTGKPVPGAEIVSYKMANGNYSIDKVYKTNASGSVTLPAPVGEMEYLNVRTGGNDFMRINHVYNGRMYGSSDEKIKMRTSLFTDRSIYRPGQTVNLSGVKYSMQGDSATVIKYSRVKLVMRDYNWKEIAAKEVTTDDFGVYSAEFIIPDNAFPGFYNITADDTQFSVGVDEYKRPTFDVSFDELKQTYTFGDSVRASALAETFAGAPLGMAKVRYRITRSEAWWWRMPAREEEITSGETVTAADGRFCINFKLTKPDAYTRINPYVYYRYKVIAEVTSSAGETQEGTVVLPVGEKSLGLMVDGISSKVAKEKRSEIRFEARNLSNLPVSVEVEYSVYDKHKSLVCQGKHMSNKGFVPDDIYSLPSGTYKIEIKACDDKNRECTYSKDFILFSVSDNCVPVDTVEWFWQDGTELTADKPVDIYVGTSDKDVYLMVDVFANDRRISSERITIDDEIRKFSYKYRSEYGDGITISFKFMRRGNLYSKSVTLLRHQPDKKLDIRWESFRDKLLPGQHEVWKLSVRDKNGRPVEANMLASAYDASLDKLYPYDWNFGLYFRRNVFGSNTSPLFRSNGLYMYMPFDYEYYGSGIDHIWGNEYTRLMPVRFYLQTRSFLTGRVKAARVGNAVEMKSHAVADVEESTSAKEIGFELSEPQVEVFESSLTDNYSGNEEEAKGNITLRENFNETAFYYPMLRTDSTGVVTMEFVMPDALTEWKFNGFAHTRNMDYGMISASFTTSKPFMVQPNVPRFVRTGDKSSISSLLINMSDEEVSGRITMTITNPFDGKKVFSQTKDFRVAEGESSAVAFSYEVKGDYDMLACTITADAGEFSDGERHYLPVLSDRQLVVENTSVQLRGSKTKSMDVKDLFNYGSNTATHHKVRIEMTANPQWHVISSLPVLSSPNNDDAISWATAFYANSLSRHIVKTNPGIKKVFDTWMQYSRKDGDFLSELKRNEQLKNIVMTETPWLAEAENEEERRRKVAFLFDENGMNTRLSTSVTRLKSLQLPDGSWSWFSGMTGSRHVTTQVATMFARLNSMGVSLSPEAETMYIKALSYLRTEVNNDYKRMKKDEKKYHPNDYVVKYLYICSIDEKAMNRADKNINSYMVDRLTGKSSSLDIYGKSVMASIMIAEGRKQEAETLLRSVVEYMVTSEEMGTYFDTHKAGYSYGSHRIPTHVAAMEALIVFFSDDNHLIDNMRLWLLKQKQVQQWDNPVASSDAIYAFLIASGGNIGHDAVMTANIGSEELCTPDDAIGFAGRDFTFGELKSALKGEKKISFTRRGEGIGWASVYTSYVEDISKVRPYSGNGMKIERRYLIDGKEITSDVNLEIGSKITVSLTVSTDRDMDFVCIKDSKAACMEPAEQLSDYGYSDGIAYYKAVRDASTEFFIDKLRKGSYTLQYEVYVTRSGCYVSGVSSIQSVYAPQFGAHSNGSLIRVN